MRPFGAHELAEAVPESVESLVDAHRRAIVRQKGIALHGEERAMSWEGQSIENCKPSSIGSRTDFAPLRHATEARRIVWMR